MQGFRSPGGLQRFTSIFSAVRNLFVPPASERRALSAHLQRLAAFARRRSVAGLEPAV
jgi:putative transposase